MPNLQEHLCVARLNRVWPLVLLQGGSAVIGDYIAQLMMSQQCIRDALPVTKRCPSCNEPAKEGEIRRNRALEEISDAWVTARCVWSRPSIRRID